MTTAEKVKALRGARGWSQEKLAKRAGLNKETVNRVELGAGARVSTLHKLAVALGSSVPYLTDESVAPAPNSESSESPHDPTTPAHDPERGLLPPVPAPASTDNASKAPTHVDPAHPSDRLAAIGAHLLAIGSELRSWQPP